MRNGQTGNKIGDLIESMYEKEGYCYGCPIKYQANKIVIDLTGVNDTTQSLVLYLLHSLVILLKHKEKVEWHLYFLHTSRKAISKHSQHKHICQTINSELVLSMVPREHRSTA